MNGIRRAGWLGSLVFAGSAWLLALTVLPAQAEEETDVSKAGEHQTGVVLRSVASYPDNPAEGDLWLLDGNSDREGRLEVYLNGEWGTVCDDKFGLVDAGVACRQLGYPGAAYITDKFLPGGGNKVMDDVACEGSEARLVDCAYNASPDCWRVESIGLKCTARLEPGIAVRAAPRALREGASGTYTVALMTKPTASVTVTVTSSDTDVTASPSSLTYAAGIWSTARTVTVSAGQDADMTSESVTLTHVASGADYGSVANVEIAVTVYDNDMEWTVTAVPSSMAEAGGTSTVTVSTGGGTFGDRQTIVLGFGGTASEDVDYTVGSKTLTLVAGASSVTATVTATGDTEVEETEEVTVVASHAILDLGARDLIGSADIDITDDDEASFSLSVSPAAIAEGSGATVTVSTGGVTFSTAQTITLDVSGSTAADTDYTLSSASLTLAPGESSVTATITAADDNLMEGDETITVVARHGAAQVGTTRNITIEANDAPSWSVVASPDMIREQTEEASTVTVSTGGVTFSTARTITLDLSGSTAASSDYTLSSASLTLAPGESSVTATITVTDDVVVEGDETVTLTARHGGAAIGTVTVTVEANDAPAFELSASPETIGEGESATLAVRTGGVTFEAVQTITLEVNSDTAEASDYVLSLASVTIGVGETEGTATIAAVDDAVVEGDETITVTALYEGLTVGTRNILILANDAPALELSVSAATIEEGAAGAVLAVSIVNGVVFGEEQTIELEVSGTAANSDYTVTPASLVIAAGAGSGEVTVAAADDNEVEGEETVVIEARHEGAPVGTPRTLTILANDAPAFELTASPVSIGEGESSVVTVRITNGVVFGAGQTIELGVSGTAGVADYRVAPASRTLTIGAGESSAASRFTAVNDRESEGAETIAIEARRNGRVIGGGARLTILAGDAPGFELTVSARTIGEGESLTVTVSTGGVTFGTDQTVTLELGGTAGVTDYRVMPASLTLTIAAGETSAGAVIEAVDDAETEEDERIEVTARHQGLATWTGTETVTISANDRTVVVRVTADVNGDGTVDEDDALVMYYAYAYRSQLGNGEEGGFEESRQAQLGGLSGVSNPTDEDLKALLRAANAWRSAALDAGGDVNGDGVIDEDDALVMYYAYAYRDQLGDGDEGGFEESRQAQLGGLSGVSDPTDADLRAMLRAANALRGTV